MITTTALHIAGHGSHVVGRPSGVAHVYVGPLTPSGRWVPRSGRAVCKTRTRRLAVLERDGSPLDPAARRLCGRCSACLSPRRQVEQLPVTREEWLARFGSLSPFDLAVDAFMAETVEEIQRLEFLALLLVGYPACAKDPVVSPAGKVSPPLDKQLSRHRTRVGGAHRDEHEAERVAENRELADTIRRRDWRDRGARKDYRDRHGFALTTD